MKKKIIIFGYFAQFTACMMLVCPQGKLHEKSHVALFCTCKMIQTYPQKDKIMVESLG